MASSNFYSDLEKSAAKIFQDGLDSWKGIYGTIDEPKPKPVRNGLQGIIDQEVERLRLV